MKHHNLEQGSAAWHAHRRNHFNASDAPAMMNCSPYKSRADLIHETATGLAAEVDAATQRRFDSGHRFEALARPICQGLTVCRVGIWTDQWSMPNAMPVRAPQLEAQEYAFGRNAKGEETSLWNCNKYPEFEAKDACLPRLFK